ncbi:hypothetical protein RD792_008463 [Penstemon davidsonii]|uniref:WRKY domain-containing protein n=1 Tax=Penstemon davidsonii TaxID=160366 RepID=A0ABR0DAG2_9LAMI|nr:hypothetical protein RD792_008463 [Penstemon davidsonii]
MEFTSLLNNSFDLNARPLRIYNEDHPILPKQEVESHFIELGRNVHVKEERGALMEELNRVSAENKKLTELLTVMCENYTELKNQLFEHKSKNSSVENSPGSRKRKLQNSSIDNGNNEATNIGSSESSSSDEDSSKNHKEDHMKPKISQVSVRSEASDHTSLIVKDGYQWRKYGQKVTRNNPSPRAYFKCSFAPSCQVKKKVQRSIEDQSIIVATYEGEHNHPHPSKVESTSGSNRSLTLGSVPCSTSLASSGPTITLDLTKQKPPGHEETRNSRSKVDAHAPEQIQQYFVEHMASTLTKDPNFKAALAAAISGQFLQHTENW